MVGIYSTYRGGESVYKTVVGKTEGTKSLERLKWEDDIKLDFKVIICGGVDWIHIGQVGDR